MYECVKDIKVSEDLKKEINLFLCNTNLDKKQREYLSNLFNKVTKVVR